LIHTDSTRGEIPAELRSTVPGNGVRIIGAKALQNIGDRIVGTASGSVAGFAMP
jgi:hypothetical protein